MSNWLRMTFWLRSAFWRKRVFILLGLCCCAVSVMAQEPACPAVDCDCEAIQDPKWQSVCQTHERAIKQECVAHNNEPQNYCRMHGPLAKPVAISVLNENLPQIVEGASQASVESKIEQMQTSEWSVEQDLVALEQYQAKAEYIKAYKTSKVLAVNSERLFHLQRAVVKGLAELGQPERKEGYATAAFDEWQSVAKRSQVVADAILVAANQMEDASESTKHRKIGQRLTRLSATLLEYSGHVMAEAQLPTMAATAWQNAASVSEQLVTRAISDNDPEKFVEYYREQASARWHRATYYWLTGAKQEEGQLSFQNAGQVLMNASAPAVAGADTEVVGSDAQ